MVKRERESVLNKTCCLEFVRCLWDKDKLAMFHYPVNISEVPDYHTVIKCPVDLSTIRQGIEAGTYGSDADVQNAVAQMITNALEYNSKGTEWYNQALLFRKEYLGIARKCGLAIDADAAYIPLERFEDDESTLRKAERRNQEDLEIVLKQLEEEKDVSLEELIAKYGRGANKGNSGTVSKSENGGGAEDDDESFDEDDDSDDEDYDEEDDDDEEDYDDDDEEDDDDDDDDNDSLSS